VGRSIAFPRFSLSILAPARAVTAGVRKRWRGAAMVRGWSPGWVGWLSAVGCAICACMSQGRRRGRAMQQAVGPWPFSIVSVYFSILTKLRLDACPSKGNAREVTGYVGRCVGLSLSLARVGRCVRPHHVRPGLATRGFARSQDGGAECVYASLW